MVALMEKLVKVIRVVKRKNMESLISLCIAIGFAVILALCFFFTLWLEGTTERYKEEGKALRKIKGDKLDP